MSKKNFLFTFIFGALYIFLMLFFAHKCLETGTQSTQSSNNVAEVIKDVSNEVFNTDIQMTDSYTTLIRKLVGHFGFFLVLGTTSFLFYMSLKRGLTVKLMYHYIIGFLFALVSEFCLEGSTNGRSASFKDVLIDYSGFIALSSILLIIYFVVRYKKKAKEN